MADIGSKLIKLPMDARITEKKNIIEYLQLQKKGRGEIAQKEISWLIKELRQVGGNSNGKLSNVPTLSSVVDDVSS